MINLLPPQEKKEIESEGKFRLVSILGTISFIFILFISLIFLAINSYLRGELNAKIIILEAEKGRIETPEIQEFQRKISFLNQEVDKLDIFFLQRVELTKILDKISHLIPPNIYLTNLSWQKETLEVNLLGFSLAREDLLKLKENLEKEESLIDVNFPPINWVKPREIDFQVSFKIKQ